MYRFYPARPHREKRVQPLRTGTLIGSGSLDFDDVRGVTIDDNSVDSRYYTDVGFTWGPQGGDASWELFFNVENLFDRDPPPAASFAQFSGTRITNDRHPTSMAAAT